MADNHPTFPEGGNGNAPIEGQAVAVAPPPAAPAAPAPAPQAPATATLWRTDDPAEVIQRATKVANALAPVLEEREMLTQIGDRRHVNITGWQTLGSMVGVMAVDPWTREVPWPSDDRLTPELRKVRDMGYAFGFDAGYTIRTLQGVVVGGGESTCRRTEANWNVRGGEIVDDFALKGMAETRAQSRAFAAPLRFVVELAGFSGTPAEVMPGATEAGERTGFASDKQEQFCRTLLGEAGLSEEQVEQVIEFMAATMSGRRDGPISKAIDELKEDKQATARQLVAEAAKWRGEDAESAAAEQPAAQKPAEPSAEEAEAAIAELLGKKSKLAAKRKQANEGMIALGAGPLRRLRELEAAKTERALDALLARINAAADKA